MEGTSGTPVRNQFNFQDVKHFPYNDGRINVCDFLEATADLIRIVDCLGKVFAPVKYDMQTNVEKIKNNYKYNKDSCLLELMVEEYVQGKSLCLEGILWLNRALLFFELVFQEIITCLQTNDIEANMKKIFTIAYEGSVKKYHNWVTQQLFHLICKMSPTILQIMKSFKVENDLKGFEAKLLNFNVTLQTVRLKIDNFYKERNLFVDPQ